MIATIARRDAPVLINRLSRLLGERRLTMQDAASGAGLSWRTVHDLYHGRSQRIDLDTLNKLCAFLDVTPAEIFEYRRREDDPAPHPSSEGVIR